MKYFRADGQVGMKSKKVRDENKKSKKKINLEKDLENEIKTSKDSQLSQKKQKKRIPKALKDLSIESADASVDNQANKRTHEERVKAKETSDQNENANSVENANQSTKSMIKAKKQLMKQSTGRKIKGKGKLKQNNENSNLSTESSNKNESKDPVEMLSKQQIKDCISAIFHLTQEQIENKKTLFASEADPIFLQVTCIRVPKMPRFNTRIDLPYPTTSPNDEVALFVPDLARGKRKDYEPTIEHYRELLNQHNCDRIKDIIPMNQVKTEYDQFEMKRKLAHSYDCFLVDSRIAGHMTHLLGKTFQHHSKIPTPVRMQAKNLKSTIDRALGRTVMPLFSSNNHIVQVGHTSMKKKHILENVLSTCTRLCTVYPGGWENIRSIHLKGRFTAALPIYMTLKRKNDVKIPIIKPKRPKAYRVVEGELTTLAGNYKVAVTPEGDIDFAHISEMDEDANQNSEEEDQQEE